MWLRATFLDLARFECESVGCAAPQRERTPWKCCRIGALNLNSRQEAGPVSRGKPESSGYPMALLRFTRRVVLGLALAGRVLSSGIVLLMMLTMTYDVIMRYVFHNPTIWAVRLNTTALLAMTVLAVPDLYARGQHISMDLVYARMSSRSRSLAVLVVRITTILVGLTLAWLGTRSTVSAYTSGLYTAGAFQIPMWIIYLQITIGAALLVLVVPFSIPGASIVSKDGRTTSAS